MKNKCCLCKTQTLNELLIFNSQPIGNRFLQKASLAEKSHPMVVVQCEGCGLIQLIDPVPANELLPQFNWITYNEPEAHLNELADSLIKLPGIQKGSSIGGISFKDDTLLSRLKKRGISKTWRVEQAADLDIKANGAGVETIQDRLTSSRCDAIARKYGLADIIIARHILEHAYDVLGFINNLKQLIKPGGYIVIEVPDCSKAIAKLDYTTLWEEHIVYFTPATFQHGFRTAGLSLASFMNYPYPFENSLVGIAQASRRDVPLNMTDETLKKEIEKGGLFAKSFSDQRDKIRKYLARFRQAEGKIAMFGAGHLACTFINIFGIKEYIEFIVDDNPNKKGLFMPGSRLPIFSSAELLKKGVKLCLLSLSPQAEEKVIANNQEFVRQGGRFCSIFPGSSLAIEI